MRRRRRRRSRRRRRIDYDDGDEVVVVDDAIEREREKKGLDLERGPQRLLLLLLTGSMGGEGGHGPQSFDICLG